MKTEKYTTKQNNQGAGLNAGRDYVNDKTQEILLDPDFDHITTWLMDELTYLKIQETKKGGE